MKKDRIGQLLLSCNVQAELLSAVERRKIIDILKEKLGVDIERGAPWDSVKAPEGIKREDGWELIPRYIGLDSCYVFSSGAAEIWRFKSGYELLDFLAESPAFEYYACDEKIEYLLCCNHHDYIIGWGRAEIWVSQLT